MKIRIALTVLCFCLGCSSRKSSWESQPRDEKGRWISELTAYAKKHAITPEIAAQANVPFEQYVYDYSVSHGPELDGKALSDYERWLDWYQTQKEKEVKH